MEQQHWHLSVDEKGFATLTLDVQDKSVNILARKVFVELAGVIASLESQSQQIKGLLLHSGKAGSFSYGADIKEFAALKNEEAVAALLDEVHGILHRLAALPFPIVVGIDGYALGGGLELALACDYVLATDTPKTMVAFPEIKLGLLPGYGGSGRACGRIGAEAVLEMMLTGRMVQARQAFEMGLVDGLADDASSLDGAMRGLLAEKKATKRQSTPADTSKLKGIIDAARTDYLSNLRPDHTPAPFAIIDHVEAHAHDPAAMSEAEKDIFPALMVSPASDGLRRVFGLQDMLRRDARGQSGIKKIHVIGAGVMGGDIAAVAAMQGFEVSVSDISDAKHGDAIRRAGQLFERRLKTPDAIAAANSRLAADNSADLMASADLVIEAVAENLEVKKTVFAAAEAAMRDDAILATNTSSIPLEEIAAALKHPQRLVGLHFFNPVAVMPLVEVIYSDMCDDESVRRLMCFSGALGKMPVKCRSAAGFLVNRALMPYVLAAIEMLLGDADDCDKLADKIDSAMTDFGMPMGPIELADQIGLDITHDASLPLGMPAAVASALKQKIEAGELGRKTGRGFYSWEDKRAIRPRGNYDEAELQDIAHTLLAPMIEQCETAIKEGVVESPEHADAAMIFGVGFPAFRGGPLHYHEMSRG